MNSRSIASASWEYLPRSVLMQPLASSPRRNPSSSASNSANAPAAMPSAARSPESGCVASTYRFDASSSSAVAPGMRNQHQPARGGLGIGIEPAGAGRHAGQHVRQRPGNEQAHRHPELFSGIDQVDKDRAVDPHRPAQPDAAQRRRPAVDRGGLQLRRARGGGRDDQPPSNDLALETGRPGNAIPGVGADQVAIPRPPDPRFMTAVGRRLVRCCTDHDARPAARESRLTLWRSQTRSRNSSTVHDCRYATGCPCRAAPPSPRRARLSAAGRAPASTCMTGRARRSSRGSPRESARTDPSATRSRAPPR